MTKLMCTWRGPSDSLDLWYTCVNALATNYCSDRKFCTDEHWHDSDHALTAAEIKFEDEALKHT